MGEADTRWLSEADAFLLGRRTYDIFAAYWPLVTDPQDPVASRLNTFPKYVATKTRWEAGWDGTTLLTADVVKDVQRLKDQPSRELQVHGSGELLQTLMATDLVDEYPVWAAHGMTVVGPPLSLE